MEAKDSSYQLPGSKSQTPKQTPQPLKHPVTSRMDTRGSGLADWARFRAQSGNPISPPNLATLAAACCNWTLTPCRVARLGPISSPIWQPDFLPNLATLPAACCNWTLTPLQGCQIGPDFPPNLARVARLGGRFPAQSGNPSCSMM